MDADAIIERLGLVPHPEGGCFRETYRHATSGGARGFGTAIYYLLRAAERSHWHRVDADEIWHWYGGAPLTLAISRDGVTEESVFLGNDLAAGQAPQALVPALAWQSAQTLGDWTLVGCTVTPAFEFEGFEMAPPQWRPGK